MCFVLEGDHPVQSRRVKNTGDMDHRKNRNAKIFLTPPLNPPLTPVDKYEDDALPGPAYGAGEGTSSASKYVR
jgi:hypothetical protein